MDRRWIRMNIGAMKVGTSTIGKETTILVVGSSVKIRRDPGKESCRVTRATKRTNIPAVALSGPDMDSRARGKSLRERPTSNSAEWVPGANLLLPATLSSTDLQLGWI